MKAAIVAIAAMIWITGCNKEAKRDSAEGAGDAAARETAEESRQAAEGIENKVEGSGQTGRDKTEGAHTTGMKAEEEARQTGRDVGEGVDKAASKTKEEIRQTSRDIGEAVAGDGGKTEADKQLTTRVRAALRADKEVAPEAADIRIRTTDGVVNLEGTVTSKDAKQDIARIAGKIAGKTKVDDDLKVAERVGAGTGDR